MEDLPLIWMFLASPAWTRLATWLLS